MQENLETQPSVADLAALAVCGKWLQDKLSDHKTTIKQLGVELDIPLPTLYNIKNDRGGKSPNTSAKIKLFQHFRYLEMMEQIKQFNEEATGPQ